MHALVIFESMYGNTEKVANAIASGLPAAWDVAVTEVGAAPTIVGEDVGLLVVGGPTHAFGMSREATRRDAATRTGGPLTSTGIGIREWLGAVSTGSPTTATAAFDTRIKKRGIPGSAARGASKRLRKLGFREVVPPESFWVVESLGPLVPGELDRAGKWARDLVSALSARPARVDARAEPQS